MITYLIEQSRPGKTDWHQVASSHFESTAWNVKRDLEAASKKQSEPPLYRVVRVERTVLYPPVVHPGIIPAPLQPISHP
jgi:hypothetical protein